MYHAPLSNNSWYTARQACLDMNSYLVEIDSSEKNEALKEYLVESGQYSGGFALFLTMLEMTLVTKTYKTTFFSAGITWCYKQIHQSTAMS